ncbi:MAG: hypothetical protein QOG20_4168 [Pseudonocardiales bacterium]|nr:hypothetical protein [Pseudonocardiales bacterium]
MNNRHRSPWEASCTATHTCHQTPLFDPLSGDPPTNAYDIYFPAPVSLSLFAQSCAGHADTRHLVPILTGAHERAIHRAVTDIQHAGGYVTDPVGTISSARLEITALSENSTGSALGVHLHAHAYVRKMAISLSDGHRLPVAQDRIRRGADLAWLTYTRTLITETTTALGLVWGALPGRHLNEQEILDPPFGHLTANRVPPPCPGHFDVPLVRIAADATWRDGVRRMLGLIDGWPHPI